MLGVEVNSLSHMDKCILKEDKEKTQIYETV